MNPLAWRIDAVLPQTQCTRCGYPDCSAYARAVAVGEANINQCPPGGAEGIARLAALTGRPVLPLTQEHGVQGPLTVAVIDQHWCSRSGWAGWSPEQAAHARGRYVQRTERLAREEVEHAERLEAKAAHKLVDLAAHSQHTDPSVLDQKRAVIEAALARARARRDGA